MNLYLRIKHLEEQILAPEPSYKSFQIRTLFNIGGIVYECIEGKLAEVDPDIKTGNHLVIVKSYLSIDDIPAHNLL